jgi:prephenate dehydratase
VAELENRPGALHALLGVFADRGLDLSHVASRPAVSPWTYRFIVEFRHASREQAKGAIEAAGRLCTRLRVLGSFPAWKGSGG